MQTLYDSFNLKKKFESQSYENFPPCHQNLTQRWLGKLRQRNQSHHNQWKHQLGANPWAASQTSGPESLTLELLNLIESIFRAQHAISLLMELESYFYYFSKKLKQGKSLNKQFPQKVKWLISRLAIHSAKFNCTFCISSTLPHSMSGEF